MTSESATSRSDDELPKTSDQLDDTERDQDAAAEDSQEVAGTDATEGLETIEQKLEAERERDDA